MAGVIPFGIAGVRITGDNKSLKQSLRESGAMLKDFGQGLATIGAGLTAVATAVITPLTVMVKKFSDTGDASAKMAERLGTSADSLTAWQHAAELSGIGADNATNALLKYTRNLKNATQGQGEAVDALKMLRLEASELAKLPLDKQMAVIADRLRRVDDAGTRTLIMFGLFGREGTQLSSVFMGGSAALEAARQETVLLGTAMGDSTKLAEELNDDWFRLTEAVRGLGNTVARILGPSILEYIQWAQAAVIATREWIEIHPEIITTMVNLIKILYAVGVAVTAVGTAFLMFATPIGLIVLIGVALIGILETLGIIDLGIRSVAEQFIIAGHSIAGYWDYLGDSLVSVLMFFQGAALVVWTAVRDGFFSMVMSVQEKWNWLMEKLGVRSKEEADKIREQLDAERKAMEEGTTKQRLEFGQKFKSHVEDSEKRFADDGKAAKSKGSFLDFLKNRMPDIKGQLDQLRELQAPEATGDLGITPVDQKMGVHGFFGGTSIAEQTGAAFGGGTVQDKQLGVLENIDETLRSIKDNTENSTPTFS